MHVQPLFAGEQGKDFVEVLPHFVAGAGAAGKVAGRHDAATVDGTGFGLETDDIIDLPAMQGNGDFQGTADRLLGVDAGGGVNFAGEIVVGLEGSIGVHEAEAAAAAAAAAIRFCLRMTMYIESPPSKPKPVMMTYQKSQPCCA